MEAIQKTLERTRSVLRLIIFDSGYATFGSSGDPLSRRLTLKIREDEWRELGEPNEVTITIEPGDLLNT